MIRTNKEVIEILIKIYKAEFGGKLDQRFNLSWSDLRTIRGGARLEYGVYCALWAEGVRRGVYIIELDDNSGERMLAVVRTQTVDRWRRVPKKIINTYAAGANDTGATPQGKRQFAISADGQLPRGKRMVPPIRVPRVSSTATS